MIKLVKITRCGYGFDYSEFYTRADNIMSVEPDDRYGRHCTKVVLKYGDIVWVEESTEEILKMIDIDNAFEIAKKQAI